MSDTLAHPRPLGPDERGHAYRCDGRPSGYDAFAQITARCSHQINHAYAVYVWMAGDKVARIAYGRGSGKFGGHSSSETVESAVTAFCAFMMGRPLEEAETISPQRIVAAFGTSHIRDVASVSEVRFDVLRDGGTLPFILLNWAWANFRVKQAVRQAAHVDALGRIALRSVVGVSKMHRALLGVPPFGDHSRALELAIRGLEGSTVDESTLRSLYQRASLDALRAQALDQGFRDPFVSFP